MLRIPLTKPSCRYAPWSVRNYQQTLTDLERPSIWFDGRRKSSSVRRIDQDAYATRFTGRRTLAVLPFPGTFRPFYRSYTTSKAVYWAASSSSWTETISDAIRSTTTGTTSQDSSPFMSSQQPNPYTPEQKRVMDECQKLHSSLMPMNQKVSILQTPILRETHPLISHHLFSLNPQFSGPLPSLADRGTALPFVLLVGNHSSGKSSFINYVLERPVQTAGVAPTDDAFSIIAPGPVDRDQDGPALYVNLISGLCLL